MAESILIQHLDGQTFNLDDNNIRVISFDPPAPNYQQSYTQIHKLGATLTDMQVQQTTIPLVVLVKSKNIYDYELMRQRMIRIFDGTQDMYVINERLPTIRWLVRPETFNYPRQGSFWYTQAITINLVCANGYAESVSSTADNDYTVPRADVSFGLNVPTDRDLSYKFNTNQFDVWNLGNVKLNAEERPVIITVDGYSSGGFTLTNKTTKQTFSYNKPLKQGTPLIIYGIKSVMNGLSVFQDTNHGFIDLAVGKNQFEASNISNFTISYDTRFYY